MNFLVNHHNRSQTAGPQTGYGLYSKEHVFGGTLLGAQTEAGMESL
jgi:hypothetical protein